MLVQRRNLHNPGIDCEKMVKRRPLLTAEIPPPGRRFRPRQVLQRLHGGQDHKTADMMIA
jgi:hypothetical protein